MISFFAGIKQGQKIRLIEEDKDKILMKKQIQVCYQALGIK